MRRGVRYQRSPERKREAKARNAPGVGRSRECRVCVFRGRAGVVCARLLKAHEEGHIAYESSYSYQSSARSLPKRHLTHFVSVSRKNTSVISRLCIAWLLQRVSPIVRHGRTGSDQRVGCPCRHEVHAYTFVFLWIRHHSCNHSAQNFAVCNNSLPCSACPLSRSLSCCVFLDVFWGLRWDALAANGNGILLLTHTLRTFVWRSAARTSMALSVSSLFFFVVSSVQATLHY